MELSNKKVLICDDSMLFRKQIKDCISAFWQCSDIYEAPDGNVAVSLYKEKKPDLVFMDIIMPGKDGIASLREILEFDQKAKVIMMSSVGTQRYIKTAIGLGAKSFFQKPIEPENIGKIIKSIV